MDIATQPSLPPMYAGGQEFAQSLAIYNNSQLFQDPGLVEQPIIPLEDIRMSTFDQTMSNIARGGGDLFAAGVRRSFLKSFGIGYQSLSAYKTHMPLPLRALRATADVSKDVGAYIYTGKAFGKGMTDATKAAKWFVPLATGGKNFTTSTNTFARRMNRLGRASRAGMKSFLGWNFILGNPDEMSAGDMTMSYLKHTAISYGIDAIASRFMRRPGAIIGHLSTLYKGDAIRKLFDPETGLVGKEVMGSFSDQLKGMIKNYTSADTMSAGRKANMAKAIRRRAGREMDRLAIKNPSIYKNAWGNVRMSFNEASAAAKAVVADGISKIPGGARVARGLQGKGEFIKNLARVPKDELYGKGFFRSLKEATVDTARFVARRPNATFDTARNSFATLTARTMRNTWALGGMALRLANVASGAVAVGGIVNDIVKYRDNVKAEYIRNMTSDRMAFSMMPEFGMAGTERTRAIQAIQNSDMSTRNYLGQEAGMMH